MKIEEIRVMRIEMDETEYETMRLALTRAAQTDSGRLAIEAAKMDMDFQRYDSDRSAIANWQAD